MALGLGGEALDQEHHDETAENRRKQHPVAEPARPFHDVGVVQNRERAVVEGVVEHCDQAAQKDRAEARQDSNPQRERAQNEQADPPLLGPRRGPADEGRRGFGVGIGKGL